MACHIAAQGLEDAIQLLVKGSGMNVALLVVVIKYVILGDIERCYVCR